jgi:error-prone DNA polymerase
MEGRYAELHAHSAFSFLDGANLPEDLAAEAARLGLEALALTDHDGLPGVVRLAEAARALGLPTVIGAELGIGSTGRTAAAAGGGTHGLAGPADPDGDHLLVLARGRAGYAHLSAAISHAHLATGAKGRARYDLGELADAARGQWMILTGCRKGAVRRALEPTRGSFVPAAAADEIARLVGLFGKDNVAVEITDTGDPLDQVRCAALAELADSAGLPLVATGGVHCARPSDVDLAHVMAATRARASLDEIDGWLPAAPAHLRSAAEMLAIHRRRPDAVTRAADLAADLAFDLRLVAPDLPTYPVPAGHTEATWLRELTRRGAESRYGPRGNERIRGAWATIDHELAVIEELGFPGYFLIVHEIVDFCARNGILAQGRGSAANSAVCFALGITAVDAVTHRLLFERFLSPGRSGPPDIDVDIESGRREEVIQFVYASYGREYAAQVANVIAYRPRSAVRDAARALGHGTGQQDAWAKSVERWGSLTTPDAGDEVPGDVTAGAGSPGAGRAGPPARADAPNSRSRHDRAADDVSAIPADVLTIAERLLRLPRHLGIHSGGMVLCSRPVIEVCPVQWASMPGRTVLQWDKDDCADAGLVKFDLLGLGMLTALRLAFTELDRRGHLGVDGASLGLHNLPHGRRVPGRVAGTDGHPAQAEAADLLRHRRRGRPHPPRPDPGAVGEPVHQPPARTRAGHLPPRLAETGAREDPRRPVVPGAAHADRDRRRELQSRRGRPAPQGHGLQAVHRTHGGTARSAAGRHGRERHLPGDRGADLRQAQGVLRLRLPRVPRLLLRLPRLRQRLAQGSPPGGLLRGAPRRPAHGLLQPAEPDRRRPPSRRPGGTRNGQHLWRPGRSHRRPRRGGRRPLGMA